MTYRSVAAKLDQLDREQAGIQRDEKYRQARAERIRGGYVEVAPDIWVLRYELVKECSPWLFARKPPEIGHAVRRDGLSLPSVPEHEYLPDEVRFLAHRDESPSSVESIYPAWLENWPREELAA